MTPEQAQQILISLTSDEVIASFEDMWWGNGLNVRIGSGPDSFHVNYSLAYSEQHPIANLYVECGDKFFCAPFEISTEESATISRAQRFWEAAWSRYISRRIICSPLREILGKQYTPSALFN